MPQLLAALCADNEGTSVLHDFPLRRNLCLLDAEVAVVVSKEADNVTIAQTRRLICGSGAAEWAKYKLLPSAAVTPASSHMGAIDIQIATVEGAQIYSVSKAYSRIRWWRVKNCFQRVAHGVLPRREVPWQRR